MATNTTLEPELIELAKTMVPQEVPEKLRCANCNLVAIDVVKLPCCEQSMCLRCSQRLTGACPVCEHMPVNSDNIIPHKSLRSTVKAWLRGEYARRKVPTGIESAATSSSATSANLAEEKPSNVAEEHAPEPDVVSEAAMIEEEATTQDICANGWSAPDRPSESFQSRVESAGDGEQGEDEEDDEDKVTFTLERPQSEREAETHDDANGAEEMDMQQDQGQMMIGQQQGFGSYGQNQNAFGGNMNFGVNGPYNPMMNMGMGMPGFGNMGTMMGTYSSPPPHIPTSLRRQQGMPALGNMDPTAMMNMMGGLGGMDMMGMMGAFGGMDAMHGMGGYGGGMGPNMGMGYNGPNGFNNQNFGNPNFGQPFSNRGFGQRGRGFRGFRGGYGYNRGRGGYGYNNQNFGSYPGHSNSNTLPHHQRQQQPVKAVNTNGPAAPLGPRGSPSYEPMNLPASGTMSDANMEEHDLGAVDQSGKHNPDTTNNAAADDGVAQTANGEQLGGARVDVTDIGSVDGDGQLNGNGEMEQQTHDCGRTPDVNGFDASTTQEHDGYYDLSLQQNLAYGAHGRGGIRGGRGGFRGGHGYLGPSGQSEATDLTPALAPPANAPSGPKAMREGKPNTGYWSRPQLKPFAASLQQTPQPEKTSELDGQQKPRERSTSKERRNRREHEDADYESDKTYYRRKDEERRRRREKERREEKYADEDFDGYGSSHKDRSRDHSTGDDHSSSRRYREHGDQRKSSRSHRNRSKDRDRHRHRHRSRSPEETPERDEGRSSRRKSKSERKHDDGYESSDRTREKDRSSRKHSRREDEYENKDRSSRHGRSSRDDGNGREREREKVPKPVEDDEIGFKIKGSRSASFNPGVIMASSSKRDRERDRHDARIGDAAPDGPRHDSTDHYKAERDRMTAARLAKEEERQNRQTGNSLGKRMSRGDDEQDLFDAPRGPKGSQGYDGPRKKSRKMSVRYEDELPK